MYKHLHPLPFSARLIFQKFLSGLSGLRIFHGSPLPGTKFLNRTWSSIIYIQPILLTHFPSCLTNQVSIGTHTDFLFLIFLCPYESLFSLLTLAILLAGSVCQDAPFTSDFGRRCSWSHQGAVRSLVRLLHPWTECAMSLTA